ncbi:MAG TPA: bifunctional UDP-sugar hydrolase/5'-nucleotidase [Caulobacteraceae bacterium]|nr:bifunctional UDP-sugar hydrolase/5'-nucleotidase [Caulobacteraceae bacterium]
MRVVVGFVAVALSFATLSLAQAKPKGPDSVSITLLSTTDLHGRIEPWDYAANKPANLGLAKIATLVKRARADAPDALLVDIGDMVQDPNSTLTNFFLAKHPKTLNPMIAVMNRMHYDAMAVGNHEFNFAPQPMWTLKGASHFPWLGANIKQPYTQGAPYFKPYIIKTIKGVRIGIVAFVCPVVEPVAGYELQPIVSSAKAVVAELRPKVDLVVVLLHSGFVRDPVTGVQDSRIQVPGENVAEEFVDQVPGVDVIVYGHVHSELPEKVMNGVLLTEAKFWGQSLARADITMTKDAQGRWQVASKHAHTIPVTADTPSDPDIMKLVRPYRQTLDRYMDTPIAKAAQTLSGANARYADNPLLDLVQRAELGKGADIALANLPNEKVAIGRGPVTVRQVQNVYPASNSNPILAMTGAQLKDALEHSASFYSAWPAPDGRPVKAASISPDQAAGVTYHIDLTRPVGDRVRDLQFHAKPVDPAQTFRVAVSSGRHLGEDGYSVYKGLPVVGQTGDMREVVIDYVRRAKTISGHADGNWRIGPPEAVAAMEGLADKAAAPGH